MAQDDVSQQLTQLEQSLEQFESQKKQFRSQLAETDAALEALDPDEEAYRVIGNIMVKQSAEKLSKELRARKETLQVRIQTIEQQEGKLRQKVKELQDRGMKKEEK